MKKLVSLVLAALFFSCAAVSAYDMESLSAKTLPKNFSYKAIPGREALSFGEGMIPYHMGQLSITMKNAKRFDSGYIIEFQLPGEMAKTVRPFFRMNLGESQWKELTRINRELLDANSPLRKNMEKTLMSLAVNALGPVAESHVTLQMENIEPFRRLEADESYVYTAGARVIYDAQGLILPMYGRAYFFPGREKDSLKAVMLFTSDEGKNPLVYAIDDLAKAAAQEELLGASGYQELGVLLVRPKPE